MNASDLFKAGKLQNALDAQLPEVRTNPADQGKRLFLFELLAFAGDLDRARRQIDAIQYDQPELVAAVLSYKSLRDCDDLFAGVLEVMAQGGYYWVPLEQIETLTLKPPGFPRDLLWAPARLELADSGGNVFLPVLYPASHEHSDEAIKLGRATDWKEIPDGPVQGVGGRTFLVDEDAISLLEWRKLEREASDGSSAA
jgi:type VI secretion system protein ImpE